MSVLAVDKNNFKEEVLQSEKTVLLDFWADWCGPCRMLSPIVDEIAQEHPEVKVCKVNVDEQPELASSFEVMSIPSLFVIKGGKIVNRSTGVRPKARYWSCLNREHTAGRLDTPRFFEFVVFWFSVRLCGYDILILGKT